MDIYKYTKLADVTRAPIGDRNLDTYHMLFGLMTELGELTDAFKRNLAYGNRVDWINVQEEIGDIMWYIAGICNVNGLNLEEILAQNINKLRVRFPTKFEPELANNRNLAEERKALTGSSSLQILTESDLLEAIQKDMDTE